MMPDGNMLIIYIASFNFDGGTTISVELRHGVQYSRVRLYLRSAPIIHSIFDFFYLNFVTQYTMGPICLIIIT